MKRHTTHTRPRRLFFVRMSRCCRLLSGRVEKEEDPINSLLPYIPLPGGPTRAHPAVSKWLSLSLLFFPSSSLTTVFPLQTHTRTHFLYHTITSSPRLHHFLAFFSSSPGMRRHFSLVLKTNTYVIIRDSSCVIHYRRLFLPPSCPYNI